jgi:serine/threonine-protein kinase HipA
MRQAMVYVNSHEAGILEELEKGTSYRFSYHPDYQGLAVSLTMPTHQQVYSYKYFPPFFEGLLPEGGQLDALLKNWKIDSKDYFSQLLVVGEDLVGAVSIKEIPHA